MCTPTLLGRAALSSPASSVGGCSVWTLCPASCTEFALTDLPHCTGSSVPSASFHTGPSALGATDTFIHHFQKDLELLNTHRRSNGKVFNDVHTGHSSWYLFMQLLGFVHAALQIQQQAVHLLDLRLKVPNVLHPALQLHHALIDLFLNQTSQLRQN